MVRTTLEVRSVRDTDLTLLRADAGKMELDREAEESRAAWEQLSAKKKIMKWVVGHQYSIMFGGWLASCAVAGSIIWKNKWVLILSIIQNML
jgi:hypothetical protein